MKKILVINIWLILASFNTSAQNMSVNSTVWGAQQIQTTPYIAAVIEQKVKDYDRWDKMMKLHLDPWLSLGIGMGGSYALNRDNTNKVISYYTVSQLKVAHDLLSSDSILNMISYAMGIDTPIKTKLLYVLYDNNEIMNQERLFITMHVRDINICRDAMNKNAVSLEGSGLTNKLIAYNLNDPQEITIYLGVKDMNKAKLYGSSKEFKKFCSDAMIDGTAEYQWYTWANYKGW